MTLPVLDPQQTNPQETEMAAVPPGVPNGIRAKPLSLLDESLRASRHAGGGQAVVDY